MIVYTGNEGRCRMLKFCTEKKSIINIDSLLWINHDDKNVHFAVTPLHDWNSGIPRKGKEEMATTNFLQHTTYFFADINIIYLYYILCTGHRIASYLLCKN